MALPPSIPTSFVPKQPVLTTRRTRASSSLLAIIGYFILAVAVVAAGLVFGYQTYLKSVHASKAQKLATAEASIDQATVEDYVRLRDRFRGTRSLLDSHVVASSFFDTLEAITLQNVRYQSLHLTVAEDRTAEIVMQGTAKSFNALAAESSTFAGEKRIKRAIFSDITVEKNGTVSFSLHAELDPALLAYVAPAVEAEVAPVNVAPQSVPAATTTVPATQTRTTATTTQP